MIDVVIKIGGRLGRGEHLLPLCMRVAALGIRHRLLIIPGGGVFADVVRQCDARFGLSDSAAHWMAILAMDQFGYLLADFIPESATVRSLEEAGKLSEMGRVPVLLPFDLLRRADALPHSWAVTADSIAAWLATVAGASTLVFMKDGKGLRNPVPGARDSSPSLVTAEQLADWQGVDGHLSRLLEGADFDLWILNGEQPDLLGELLDTGRTEGMQLLRCDP